MELEEFKTDIKPFDYSVVDNDTEYFLKAKVYNIQEIVNKAYTAIGKELKEVQDKLSKKGYGCFEVWCESLGFKKSTANKLINRYILIVHNMDVQDIIEDLPLSLSYEISKPSAPKELVDATLNGDITTHKDYKILEARMKTQIKWELEEQFADKLTLKNDEMKILEEEKAFLENRVTKLEKSSELIKQKEIEIADLKKFLEIEEHNSQTIGKSYDKLEAVNKKHYENLQKAEKELAEIKAAEPKVVEKVIEKEVIPDDYEELKKLKEQQEQTAKEIAMRERELKKKQDALDEEQMKFLNNRFDRDKILGFRNKLEKANGVISEEIGKIVMLHFEIEDKNKVDENIRKLIQEMNEQMKKLSGLIGSGNQGEIIEGEVLNGTLCE
jgi:hypothetical protein